MPTGLTINVVYDASVARAPTGFKTTVAAAVAFLESQFSTPLTFTINVGYGEVDGAPVGSLGASVTSGINIGYQTLRSALLSRMATADEIAAAASLPVNDPTNGGSFYLSYAEAEALGLSPGPGPDVAVGSIGISSTAPLTYAATNQAASGTFDALGLIEHEITELMGRTASLGGINNFGIYTPLDLFRYASSGSRALTPGPGSFSIDGMNLLAPFNNPLANSGDAGDWAASVTGDSFDASSVSGTANGISPVDLRLMDVIGFTPASARSVDPAPTVVSVTASPAAGNFATGAAITLTVTMSEAVTVSGGPPTLSLNDGGSAVYDAARSAGSRLIFDYAVQAGQSTSALGVTALNTNGAAIRDVTGNTAVLTGAPTSLPGLSVNVGGGLIASLTVPQQLELIYIGYFNRSADIGGSNFWSGQLTAARDSGQGAASALTNIANAFTPQAETLALYPFLGTANVRLTSPAVQSELAALIDGIYGNLFSHAADATGAGYWLTQISSGAIGLGAAILAIANGAIGSDGIALLNKITVASWFTAGTSAAGLGVFPPLPTSFLAAAHDVLSGVDGSSLNDMSVATGEAAATAYVAGAASRITTSLAATEDSATISASIAVYEPGAGGPAMRFIAGADTVPRHGGTDQTEDGDFAQDDRPGPGGWFAGILADVRDNQGNPTCRLQSDRQDATPVFDPLGYGGGVSAATLAGAPTWPGALTIHDANWS